MIREDLRLGIDLGIGSCGWAVIRYDGGERESGGEILGMGTRTFDVPETDKERTPTNQLRRVARGMRRVLKRRRQRMGEIRRMFAAAGLIDSTMPDALKLARLDPWTLRAEGLDRLLTGPELAVALGHIAKHRGFKSNSKRERGADKADDASKMLSAIASTQERMTAEGCRTVGEMLARDEAFVGRKRNRDGKFDRSVLRDDQAAEVRQLFAAQRRLINPFATAALEQDFADKAFFQRPLRDSDDLVGFCPFEPTERRAARRAPSFERFRFLSRLAALRIIGGRDERALTADEMGAAEREFGKTKSYTWKALRKAIGLDVGQRFAGVAPDDEKNDFVARSGNAAEGTASLRDAILSGAGETVWHALLDNAPEKLDAAAAVMTFRDDLGSIREGLASLDLNDAVLAALMRGIEDGRAFKDFTRAGHISAAASRNLVGFLREGLVYSEACKRAGYDHAVRSTTDLAAINNPVARKALTEALKQVKAVVAEYGLPGAIHVELARDVGKSKDERDEISRGIEKRNRDKDRLRSEFETTIGIKPSGPEDLMRFELWREQGGRCLYTDIHIAPHRIVASDNSVQVDHILPWSRSGDDSFVNKTLCLASANQEKRGRTPFEWFGSDVARWDHFVAAVEGTKSMKGRKKRNYLMKDAAVLEEKFRPRNLNDTRYACRMLLNALKVLYPKDDYRADLGGVLHKFVRVYSRPGPLTDRLRRAWGIQELKKDKLTGKRLADDRHHALDALIVAATTNSALIRLTKAFQEAESLGSHRDFSGFAPPWNGFVEETRCRFEQVFVSRAERRRARGEAHAATVRSVGEQDGKSVVYERKGVDKLTLDDLALIKDPERNGEIIAELRRWIEAKKPASAPPLKQFTGRGASEGSKACLVASAYPDAWSITLALGSRARSAAQYALYRRYNDEQGLVERGVNLERAPSVDDGSARKGPIRKVTLRTKKKPDVLVRDGAADRGEMTRVDVFRKANRRGAFDYFLVPIYPHQIFDKVKWPQPPNRAVSANMEEEFWPEMGPEHEFCWSLYPLSLVELIKPNGDHIFGYMRSMSRSTGAFSISPPHTLQEMQQGIGGRTLKSIRKFTVDRLGRPFPIERETRTWHGAACT